MAHQGKSRGLVLRTRNYSEKDRWVTLLTPQQGRQDFLAKGVRSLTSRRRALLQSGSLIRLSWVGKGETKLLTEAVQEESLVSSRNSLAYLRDVSAVLEIVFHVALPDHEQAELFHHTLELLQYLKEHQSDYHRGYVRQQLLEMLYNQGITTPEEVQAKSAAQVFESVIGYSVKSFTFLNV